MDNNTPLKKSAIYDAAEFFETDEDVISYLNTAFDDGDPALVSAARNDVVRACEYMKTKQVSDKNETIQ